MTQKNIAHLFNKFAGKEVQVTETVSQTKYGAVTDAKIAPSDPVVAELRKVAADAGLRVRLHLPNSRSTMDYWENRVNVSVQKGADGKYRIGSNFRIG